MAGVNNQLDVLDIPDFLRRGFDDPAHLRRLERERRQQEAVRLRQVIPARIPAESTVPTRRRQVPRRVLVPAR